MTTRPIVLFDADCGFCSKTARLLPTVWFRSDVTVQALQSADLDAWGLDHDDVLELMHVVRPDGSAAIGHLAWAEILLHSRAPWPLVGHVLRAKLLNRPAAKVYACVAANRDKMSGGTPACSLDDRPTPTTPASTADR